jgi:hypothetical protein
MLALRQPVAYDLRSSRRGESSRGEARPDRQVHLPRALVR